jgi:hypothetical protein
MKLLGGIFKKVAVRSLLAQTRNVDFVETAFTSRTDLIFVRYSFSSNCVPSKDRFRFLGNAAKVNCIWDSEKVCATSLHRSVGRENCYWSSPAQSFLVLDAAGLMTIFFCLTILLSLRRFSSSSFVDYKMTTCRSAKFAFNLRLDSGQRDRYTGKVTYLY